MQYFLLIMESRYKTSSSSTNSLIFLIKLRLDISDLFSTHKKTRQRPKADAGIFLWAATPGGTREMKSSFDLLLLIVIFKPSGEKDIVYMPFV